MAPFWHQNQVAHVATDSPPIQWSYTSLWMFIIRYVLKVVYQSTQTLTEWVDAIAQVDAIEDADFIRMRGDPKWRRCAPPGSPPWASSAHPCGEGLAAERIVVFVVVCDKHSPLPQRLDFLGGDFRGRQLRGLKANRAHARHGIPASDWSIRRIYPRFLNPIGPSGEYTRAYS
eukprot:1195786-Prorocentrum_minimum.AAC.6